jgi:tRNA-Thr(GGU) m(6)t(6)A37 methyltransferase TsaA
MIVMVAVKPIGYVETDASEETIKRNRWHIISRVILYKSYELGLKGLDGYSHIIVVYWMHKLAGSRIINLLVRPRGRLDLPEVGVFATRNPRRPNPIGVTVAELLEIRYNILTVRGLDALNHTPILDIKPYDYYDIVENPRVPDWFKRIWDERRR